MTPKRLAGPLIALMLLALAPSARAEPVTVFGAASLTDAFSAIGAAYHAKTGQALRFSFAASSTLARQIEAGAPVDIFASAHAAWMDRLEARGMIAPGTRRTPITNRLVLVAPATSPSAETVHPLPKLLAMLGNDQRVSVGDPAHVPAGIYARQALHALGLWDALAPRLARADNVRAALALVARGETPLGIVYATDARLDPAVRVLGLFPEDSHAPIAYPFAIVANRDNDAVRDAFAFITGRAGLDIFARFGFFPG